MLIAIVANSVSARGDGMQDDGVKPPSSFEVPFEGGGQLATIWSWGLDQPDGGKALVLTCGGETRRIDVEAPTRVRWRSPKEIIVEQFVRPVRDGSGTRIVRMSRQGDLIAVLSDRRGFAGTEPAPGGRFVALQRYNQKGFQGLEVRSLTSDFDVQTDYATASGASTARVTEPVWNPDGSQFAVGLYLPNPPEEPGRLYTRLAVASRDEPGFFTRVPDSLRGETPERWAVIPLFWRADGIYVRSNRGLLRCDDQGSGCAVVYKLGEHRAILAGRYAGDQKALLLVRDLAEDALEARAKEIHEVDLASGQGRVLLRLPQGVFVSDLDWISDSDDA